MEKTYKRKLIKKIIKKEFIKRFKNSFLNFSFIIIYTIHKILVLIKNNLNYLKDNIFECFFKKFNRLLFFKTIILFHNM